jgi:hypothetical protein
MSEAVTLLLENFHQNRRDYGKRLGEMLQQDPVGFEKAAAKYLCRGGNLPSEQIVVWLLQKAGMLVGFLLDPELSSLDEVVYLAKVVKKNAARVDVELARALKEASDAQAARILRLLAEIADNNRTLPLLTAVLRDSRSELRCMAATIFARHCQNTLFVENAMRDRDPNVRASAIEGMGLSGRKVEPAVLQEAVQDSNPRVRASALLARYRLGDKRSMQLLTEMAEQGDPEARGLAIGALGETRDLQCLKLLERLRSDPEAPIRKQVEEALTKLRLGASSGDEASPTRPIALDVLSASLDPAGTRGFHVALTTPGGIEVIDLAEHHFSLEEDGSPVTACEIQTPANRAPLHFAFVLDCSGSITAEETQTINAAVIRSLQEKLPNDKACVYKFSLDVERSVGLTESLSALTSVVRRRHLGQKTASRMHDAVCRAVDELRALPGFRAVIAIADGADRGSENNLVRTIERVKASGVPLFMIGFGSEIETAELRELALHTAGRFELISAGQSLSAACQKLVRSFASHYAISYARPNPPREGFRIQVKAPSGQGEIFLTPPWQNTDEDAMTQEPAPAGDRGAG